MVAWPPFGPWVGCKCGDDPAGLVAKLSNARHVSEPTQQRRAARDAEICIFVGSETGSTNGFALALHNALIRSGYKTHTSAMSKVGKRYPRAKYVLILGATYGDGAAPKGADGFIPALRDVKFEQTPKFSVFGFGDRAFPKFCAFAHDIDAA